MTSPKPSSFRGIIKYLFAIWNLSAAPDVVWPSCMSRGRCRGCPCQDLPGLTSFLPAQQLLNGVRSMLTIICQMSYYFLLRFAPCVWRERSPASPGMDVYADASLFDWLP